MKKLNRVGEKYTTNEGYSIEIIKYDSKRDITVSFENNFIVKVNDFSVIKKGKIKNPYHKSILGVGYIGVGSYKSSINNTQTKQYKDWLNMLQRGYNQQYKEKYPTYKDVTVCEEWHNFQNFAKWHENNYIEGFVLDKDIICKDCKIYSPETCAFVPQEINNIFTDKINELLVGIRKRNNTFTVRIKINGKEVHIGSYSTQEEAILNYCGAKEKIIKESANKHKDKLSLEVYESLINFKINNYGNE
jgi:hypothetical protein